MGEHLGRDGDVAQRVAVEDVVAVDEQQRGQVDGVAFGHGQPLDEQGLALHHAVLLATGFDDRVHGQSDPDDDGAELAVAPERRRPPLRPRRRGFDSSSSSSVSEPSPPDEPAPRAGDVDQRGDRGRATDLVDPHQMLLADVPRAALDLDDVAVDLGHRIARAVHVGLDDLHVDLLALAEGQCALQHLLAVTLQEHPEVVERKPLGSLEVKPLAGLLLDRPQRASAIGGELGADPGVHLDQDRLGRDLLGQVAHATLELDRDRLLGLDHALAVTGRTGSGHDLPHPVGDVLPGHLDQAQRGDLDHERLGPVLVQRLAQRLEDGIAVARARHVDEVDDDDAADVAQAQLADDLVGRLQVGLGDRVLEPGTLAAADERARVDVDDGQRLGVIDHQIAAAGQIDSARERGGEHVLDPEGLEQGRGLLPQVDLLDQLGRGPGEERDQAMVLLGVVDDRPARIRPRRCRAPPAPRGRPPGRRAPAPGSPRRASGAPRRA